jgi:hypothetical protein
MHRSSHPQGLHRQLSYVVDDLIRAVNSAAPCMFSQSCDEAAMKLLMSAVPYAAALVKLHKQP